MRTRLAALIGPVLISVAAVTTLAGCGSDLGPDLHPGSAAVVGDVDVSFDEVDDYADALCDWQKPAIAEGGTVLPMSFVKAVAMDSIVNDVLTHQFVEEKALEPPADYKQAIASLKAAVAADRLPEKVAATRTAYESRLVYHQAMMLSAGRADLAAAGQVSDDAGALQRGQEVFDTWRESADVSIDPRFGSIEVKDNALAYAAPADALSVTVSDLAKRAAAGQDDKEYVESLPPAQRCGGD